MSSNGPPLENREIPAFPPWLDLPPGYIVNDWIRWEKGKLVAKRLRERPEDVQLGIQWLEKRSEQSIAHDDEWMTLLKTGTVERIAGVLEAADYEGQRLRSGMPFKGEPFVSAAEMDAIYE